MFRMLLRSWRTRTWSGNEASLDDEFRRSMAQFESTPSDGGRPAFALFDGLEP